MPIFGSTIDNLHHGLTYASINNKTISNNLANMNTANYKAKKVEFKSLLDQETTNQFVAKRTDSRHIDFGRMEKGFRVYSHENLQYNHNGNNVDVDKEMVELANNQLYHQALVDRLNGSFGKLENVIRGGS